MSVPAPTPAAVGAPGPPLLLLLRFLRPRQWPILSCQLAVGVLAAPAAALGTGAAAPRWELLALAWAVWVPGLNGGTLAFNSAHDRDTEDIAYLRSPPPPPSWLAAAAIATMLAALAGGLVLGLGFAAVTAGCVLLSLLYSHPRTRWKGVPGLDLAVNMVGYGAGTTLAGLLAGQAAWRSPAPPDTPSWLLVAAFALLFGSFYPLSQLYQLDADRRRGDRTLASALGARRALVLAIALGAAAAPLFLAAASRWRSDAAASPAVIWCLTAALGAWLLHLAWWLARAPRLTPRAHEQGMYRALLLWAGVDAALLLARFAP